jgi:drug/metabolite transporter (DMT)-like permease
MTTPAEPAQPATRHAWTEYALLGVLALCWGLTYPLTKIGIETIPPITFICWRNFAGVAVLLPILLWRGKRLPGDRATWRVFGFQQLINGTIPFLLITWAQLHVPAALTVVLSSTTPIWAFLIAWGVTRHEPATRQKFAGVVLGLAGAILIIGLEALHGLGQNILAQFAIVAASLSFAIATVNGRSLKNYDPMVLTAGSVLFGGLLLLPFSLIIERPWTLAPSRASLVALVIMAATGTAIGLLVFYRLVNTLGPIATNSSSYLRIPVGVGLSIFLLGETVPPSLWSGLALVVAGVVAMTVPPAIWARLWGTVWTRRGVPSQ